MRMYGFIAHGEDVFGIRIYEVSTIVWTVRILRTIVHDRQ